MIDAVVSLPLNVFYGAGVPACLLILNKERPSERHDKVLLVYAARHYREQPNQNELRPQDVMRILVHYHAYGDASKVPELVGQHISRVREQINQREIEEVQRLETEYKGQQDKLAKSETEIAELQAGIGGQTRKAEKIRITNVIAKIDSQRQKLKAKIAERDERIEEARQRAEGDRKEVADVGTDLGNLYGNPNELLKHARVVSLSEIQDNEFNLNIPRYVDTFEPEQRIKVEDAVAAIDAARGAVLDADDLLRILLKDLGYAK